MWWLQDAQAIQQLLRRLGSRRGTLWTRALLIGRLKQLARDRHADVEGDYARHHITLQGGRWHRGEYTIQPHPDGGKILYRVRNVAQQARWVVPLVNRFFIGAKHRTR